MEIRPYVAPLVKWWWLIVIATLLAALTSFLVVRNQPPVYTAYTTLIIGKTITDPNPSSNEFWLNQQLTSFYMDLSYRDPIKEAAMKELGIKFLPNYVVKPLGNNQFLQINVTDTNPLRAKLVADALAAQLIKASPGATMSGNPTQDQFTADQLTKTQAQIVQTEAQIAQKQNDLGSLQSAHELEAAKQDLQTLQDKLSLLRTNYASLLANSKPAVSNILEVIEPATVPVKPSGLSKYLIIAIASIAGLALGTGAAYLLEGLDDTLKSPKDVEKVLGLPTIGYLMDLGKRFAYTRYVEDHPRSTMAEAFRSIRTSLEIIGTERSLKTILITSPEAGDGKSSVAVNLAINMVQGGKQVILVDGDLRRPTVHKYFEIEDRLGLSDVLKGSVKIESVLNKYNDGKLRVLTAGAGGGEDSPDKFLTPENIDYLFERLKGMADVVIIDNPPFLISDTLLFASKVDGVLLVVRPGATTRELARLIKDRITTVNNNILGVVLNRIPLRQVGYFSDYRYYMPYYYNKEKDVPKDTKKKLEPVKKSS